jgi:hypothetical protein
MRNRSALITLTAGPGAPLADTTAYTAFNADTSVSTTHQATTMTALTVVATDTDHEGDQTALWPGHPADPLITVANANEVPVTVAHINSATWKGEAPRIDNTSYANRTDEPATGQLGPARTASGPGQLTLRLPRAVTLSATTPTNCQGTKVTVQWLIAGENA